MVQDNHSKNDDHQEKRSIRKANAKKTKNGVKLIDEKPIKVGDRHSLEKKEVTSIRQGNVLV